MLHILSAPWCSQTGTEDPFSQMAQGKKKRVENNKKSQLQNAKEAAQQGQLPPTLKLAAVGLGPGSGSNSKAAGPRALPKAKRKELQEEVGRCFFSMSVRLYCWCMSVGGCSS